MVFWNVLNLMIWMRAIGVEMKMLRGAVDGVDGVVCRELDDALVTDL